MSLWGDEYIRKEVKQFLDQLEAAAAVKVATKAAVKVEAMEKVAAGPAKPATLPVVVEITPLQKAKASS